MKKTVLSLCTVATLSSLSFAGGDFVPIPVPVAEEVVVDDSGFYAGVGATYNIVYGTDSGWFSSTLTQDETAGLTGIIGYDFNTYIGVEGRFTKTFWERNYSDTTIYSLFLKPQYRFRDADNDDNDESYFAVYALLGFGNTYVEGSAGDNVPAAHPGDIGKEMMNETGFQWGLGLSYTFKDAVDDKPYKYKDTWTIFVDYTSNVKNASITPTRLYSYDDEYYDELSVEGITVGLIYNF